MFFSVVLICLLGFQNHLDDAFLVKNQVNVQEFHDIARIDKVVKLETTPESVIGYVNKVVVSPKENQLIVKDADGFTLKIFSEGGKYIKTAFRKGDGPGEMKSEISSFCLSHDSIYIITHKQLSKFDLNGRFLKEISLPDICFPGDVGFIKNAVFVSVLRSYRENKREIIVFDEDLRLQKEVLNYDVRKDKYLFTQTMSMCPSGDKLLFVQLYSPEFVVMTADAKSIQSYSISQLNKDVLDKIWEKTRFVEDDRTQIKRYMHRFSKLSSYGTKVILFDLVVKPNLRSFMYEYDGKTVKVYRDYHFSNQAYVGKSLTFPHIPGGYKDGAIGIVEHDEDFDFLAAKYKEIKNANHQSDDNQLLVFFRPKARR